MKLALAIICCIGLLACIGCVGERSDQYITPLPPEESLSPKETQEPLRIIDEEIPHPIILHIEDARIERITTSSAFLRYSTDHPSTAHITVIAVEREVAWHTEDIQSTYHSVYISGLQHSTPHIVIIEATGSPTARKVLRFTTAAPMPIHPGASWSGYSFPKSYSGTITANWYSGDGIFNNSTWSINAYPGETKQCTISIHNSLGYSVTVILQSSLISYPINGGGKVSIIADSVTISNGQTVHLIVNAIVGGDAPVGLYEFELQLAY